MPRLLFEKTGRSVWMSHLDTMRLFQRAFKRAGLHLKHTQGFNPRPSVSIALPLSVGVESICELLDFELDNQNITCYEICSALNEALIDGVRVRKVYENGRKIGQLSLLRCAVDLQYDNGVCDDAVQLIADLFHRERLIVEKKSKSGPVEQDIIPMIRKIDVTQPHTRSVRLEALICCQNPTLNPMQLCAAIEKYLPQLCPDHALCQRLEVYDNEQKIFR